MNELLKRENNICKSSIQVRDVGHVSPELIIMAALTCCHTCSTVQRLTDRLMNIPSFISVSSLLVSPPPQKPSAPSI